METMSVRRDHTLQWEEGGSTERASWQGVRGAGDVPRASSLTPLARLPRPEPLLSSGFENAPDVAGSSALPQNNPPARAERFHFPKFVRQVSLLLRDGGDKSVLRPLEIKKKTQKTKASFARCL